MGRIAAVLALGAVALVCVAGCGGGPAAGDAARAGSKAEKAGKAAAGSRAGLEPIAGTVASLQVLNAGSILERYAAKLAGKQLDDEFHQAVCAAVDVARGTSVDEVAVGVLLPYRNQLQGAIKNIERALAGGDHLGAFLAIACA